MGQKWQKPKDRGPELLGHPTVSHNLAASLAEVLSQWEAGPGADLPPAERSWRIAEALHLLTWLRPFSHSPLMLLFDEERAGADAPALRTS